MALVMGFAVTALFSLMPFKVPRVAFFVPTLALEAPAQEPGLRAMPLGTEYTDATALEPVHGGKQGHSLWTALMPVSPLFSGVRAQACLSPWKARTVALPPRLHVRLRAPPALG